MTDAGYLQNLRDEAKCRKYEKTVISQTEAIFRRPVNIQRQLNDHFRIEFPLRPTPAQFREFYTATRERYRAICFMSVPGVLYDGTPVQIPVTAPSYILCFLKSFSYAMSILLCSSCDVLLLTLLFTLTGGDLSHHCHTPWKWICCRVPYSRIKQLCCWF